MTDNGIQTKTDAATIDDLRRRIEQLEKALASGAPDGAGDRLLKANLDAVVKQLNDLRGVVDQMAKHLAHSAGYRLRDTFECDKCHSRGHAAVRVSCTVCNRESWLGWFPSGR